MKKIMIAAMSLSLLTGTVVFAQNTSSTDGTMKKHSKKHKSKKTDSTSTTSTK